MHDGFVLTQEQRALFLKIVDWRPKTYVNAVREDDDSIMAISDVIKSSLPLPIDVKFGDHCYLVDEGEEDWFECGHVTIIVNEVTIDGEDYITIRGKRGHAAGKDVRLRFYAHDTRGSIIVGKEAIKLADKQDEESALAEANRRTRAEMNEAEELSGIQDP